MHSFDWISFFHEHRIEYVESGANVKRGEINIKCPFCGSADSSHHMGVDYKNTGWFACWRSKAHGGKNPAKLIRALLRCSWKQAVRIAEKNSAGPTGSIEDLKSRLDSLDSDPDLWWPDLRTYKIPANFFALHLVYHGSIGERFLRYLRRRGIDDPRQFAERNDMYGAFTGVFKNRVIFPITFEHNLVGWTGRSINSTARIKYHSFPPADESPAIDSIPWNYDKCSGGKYLIVTEGPFDAAITEHVGSKLGVHSMAMMGINPSARKIHLIRKLVSKYYKVLIVFDRNAEHRAVDVASAIPGSFAAFVPGVIDDLGEVSSQGLRRLLRSFS